MENVKKMARLFGLIFMIVAFVCAPVFADVCPPGYGYYDKYTKLEYIESTGTQYIDTGVKIDTITARYETKITLQDVATTQAVFGSRNTPNTADKTSCQIFVYNNSLRLDWASGDSLGLIEAIVNKEYVISITRGEAVVNGTYYKFNEKTKVYQENNFLIGNLTNGSSEAFSMNSGLMGFIGRTYYGKLYSSGVLVGNFIPARRNGDNTIGLYDTVTGIFFENAGTGEFIAGPDVANGGFETMCFPCEPNTYKSESGNTECTPCPDTLVSASGSTDINDCGRVLHLGDNNVFFLRGNRQTTPALHVRDNDGNEWYGNLYQKQ